MKWNVKKMVLVAMLAAVAYIMVFLIRIPVVLFLSYEPKDVIITIGGFLLGPGAAFVCSLVVSLVEMVSISETGIIGCVMNLLSTCSFACTAAAIYKKRHDLTGAILGLYMGVAREAVEELLLPAFLPFNLLKAGFNSALTLLLYKPVVTALRRTSLVEGTSSSARGSKWGVYLLSGILLVTCVLLLLALQGKT